MRELSEAGLENSLLQNAELASASQRVADFFVDLVRPGTGHVYNLRDPKYDGTTRQWIFTGDHFQGRLEEGPSSSIYAVESDSQSLRLLYSGGRLARPSPRTGTIALVDKEDIVLLDVSGAEEGRCELRGRIEQVEWSPSGELVAVLLAGASADVSSKDGAHSLKSIQEPHGWQPEIDVGDDEDLWRTIWVWRPESGCLRQVSSAPLNVWEFNWIDDRSISVIASDHHGEGSWYHALLQRIDINGGAAEVIYRPQDQIALPKPSPNGGAVTFIEAICSDRGIACGALMLEVGGSVRSVDTAGVDVSDVHWLSNDRLVFVGLRGLLTVVCMHDLSSGSTRDIWSSLEFTCGEWHPSIAIANDGRIFAVFESYHQAPFFAEVAYATLNVIIDTSIKDSKRPSGSVEPISWAAEDGTIIEGWLISSGMKHAPLLVDIHGGPVWAHRNRWAFKLRAAAPLVDVGWSVLLANPRGSPGRGRDFVSGVVGDMGGADAQDILSGIDYLVNLGLVHNDRVALTGTSYGGFMSAWLPTITDRFAASVPISPASNWYSLHYTSQIPSFDEIFLNGSILDPSSQYFSRSPVFFAHRARTPFLLMAGSRDKCAPPTQALEFHNALLQSGCPSMLCTYPLDGHSLRGWPAYADSAVRTLGWLETYCGDTG